jgi:hypothetical protein
MDASRSTFFDGLLWYLETRNWAFEKMRTCPVGSQGLDIKMHHYLYFSNLFGAIEIARDYSKKIGASSDIEETIRQNFGGSDDYQYARELRNAIVHRGIDPAAAGHADKNVLYVVCPSGVTDRAGKKNLSCSFKYSVQLAERCNQVVNPVIVEFLEENGFLAVDEMTANKEETLKAIRDTDTMPDWAKTIAVQAFDKIDLDQMAETIVKTRIGHVKELLGCQ